MDEASIKQFRQSYRHEFGAAGTNDPLYEAVSAGKKQQGVEHWLPFFYIELETLFDYLPGSTVVLDDQFDAARLSRWDMIADQYEARKVALQQKVKLDSIYKPTPPELLYLDDNYWQKATNSRRVVSLSVLPQPTGINTFDRMSGHFSNDLSYNNRSVIVVGTELQIFRKFEEMLKTYGWQCQDDWSVDLKPKYLEYYKENNNSPIIINLI